MSVYPKFNGSNNVFNASNQLSAEDGLTTVSLDLSSFVQKSNAVFDAPIYLAGNASLNFQGKIQSSAYDDTEKQTNNDNKVKLTNISYDGTSTKIDSNLDLRDSTMLITDETIPISKITNLSDTLTGIQDNLSSINSNDADILALQTEDVNQQNRITTLETTTQAHTTAINLIETDVLTNQVDIANNLASINTHTTNISDNLSKIELNKTNIEINDGEIIDLQNNVASVEADVAANLTTFNNYKTLNDANIVTIENDISANSTDIASAQADIISLNTVTSSHGDELDALDTLTQTHSSQISSIETVNTNQTNDISSLQTLTGLHTANLATLDASTASNLSQINNLITQQALNSASIATNTSDIATKQSTISSTNRINASHLGNGDISNAKLSALNDISTTTSIQNQLNTLSSQLSVLDSLQDLDEVNIPQLQSDVSTLQGDVSTLQTQSTANTALANTKHDIIDSDNKLNSSLLNRDDNLQYVDVSSSIDTSLTNLQNSVTTNSAGITALVNADVIHDSQIASLTAQDTLLQSNIDLKQNIISLTNKLSTTKIFDTGLNDSLNNILDTIDTNINTLNLNKQNKITSSSKLDSSLLDLSTTPLQYVDITSNLKAQLTNITNAINTLQSLTTNDTITSFQTIEDNFDTLEATKLDLSVYNDTIAPQITSILSSISTLQGLQDGDVISFAAINSSITNLTNTKHPLIDTNNKLDSSLLNRNDNLQYVDVSSSIDTALTGLQTNIDAKHDIIDGSNKLAIANVDLGTSALSHVDISASLQTKLNSLDTQISTLSSTDVSQASTNTSLQNQINTLNTNVSNNDTDISALQAVNVTQATTNTSVASDITALQNQNVTQATTNASLQSQITTNASNIALKNDIIDGSNKLAVANVDLTNSSLAHVDITSGLQDQLDALASSGGGQTLKYSGTGVDIFDHLSFDTRLPAHEDNETEMSFTISGLDDHFNGNYKCIQSSYTGAFDFGQNPAVQTTSTRGMTHLFTDATIASGDSYYRSAFNTVWFKDTGQGGLVQYTDWAYNSSTGNYEGNTSTNNTGYTVNHSTTATNSNTYSGEYLEFQFPFLYEISKVKMTSGTYTTFLPSETSLLGSSDDGVTWEFIEQLSYARNTVSVINHSVSTSKKYSRFKLIFQQLSNYQGVSIEHLEFEGDVYSNVSVNSTLNSFIITQTATNAVFDASINLLETFETTQGATNTSHQNQINTANTNIATNTTDISTNTTNIATNTTNIATNTTNIATNTTDIATNTTDIATNTTNIATNTTNIATNSANITTANTNIALKLNSADYKPKIDDISTGSFASNSLSYTFNEDTIYMNQLTVSNPFELDLTINSPQNNKTYKQKVIVDCLEFKGYINALKINTETVEIKYLDGDGAINLAPIAGYSNILQTLEITRINNAWFCLSKMQLFFNSASNTAYFDPLELPVITINDSATINHEINSGAYSDAGATAIDAADVDLTGSIIVSGDTVNVAVLGVYQIHYDVTDARSNNAVRKTRVVNVIDTTNPVVTLIGDAEITIAPNSTYTEQGATASDNSNETLSVVISGDTVNTSVQGDYTILYTATDSTGNSHQISRLVHVDGPVLEWSNPTVDIFEGLIDMWNLCPYLTGTTIATFTKSGDVTNPFLNGDYTVIDCWHHSNSASYDTRNIFRNASTWSEQDYNASNAYTCQTFGSVVPPFNQRSYPSNFAPYQGHLDSNSLNVFYTVTATNSQTYNGLHHTFKFPFSVEVSKVDVVFMSGGLNYALLGSNDDGTTWDFILENTTNDASSPNVAITVSTTAKYNMFRLIYTACEWLGNNINLKQVKLYGDIYTV